MTERVSEEAEAFRKLAPEVLGRETLHQKALKPPARFRPRVGAAAEGPPPSQWKERELVSEYGFASFTGGDALHELRQVESVDGHKVAESKKAQDALASLITAGDDQAKKTALKEFQKFGLAGAVTDFGQLILLFTRRELERYEFSARGPRTEGNVNALVFSYKQLDGPEALTLFDESKKDKPLRLRVEGEIWVRPDNYVPLRITLNATTIDRTASLREEAAVDYAMSRFGALLPVATTHRELRQGQVVMENHFTYGDFHKFGASSAIQFDTK